MAASPAGRHPHGLVIKLPVVTADIEVVAGMVFKVGRQPVHQQSRHHARRHNPAERVINAEHINQLSRFHAQSFNF